MSSKTQIQTGIPYRLHCCETGISGRRISWIVWKYWYHDKIAPFLLMTFQNKFSLIKIIVFLSNFMDCLKILMSWQNSPKIVVFLSNFIELVPSKQIENIPTPIHINFVAIMQRHTIVWTNDDLIYLLTYVSFGRHNNHRICTRCLIFVLSYHGQVQVNFTFVI